MLKLDINLLWTVVNVLVMYAVLRKFLFKPVQDVIAKRQQMVDANLADAETSKKEAAETMNAAQEKLRNASRQTPSWQPARQAPRPNARASCGKPMPRPRHWPVRCARSCWPAI